MTTQTLTTALKSALAAGSIEAAQAILKKFEAEDLTLSPLPVWLVEGGHCWALLTAKESRYGEYNPYVRIVEICRDTDSAIIETAGHCDCGRRMQVDLSSLTPNA